MYEYIMKIYELLNSKFEGKKTYSVAAITVLSAFISYFAGELSMFQALQIVVPAVMGATIRHGVKTEATKTATVAIVSAEIASGNDITGTL